MTDDKELYEYAAKLCEEANEEDGVLDVFWNRISSYPEILKEFEYYREHNDFLCELKVSGITVADILVWQIDRFKAAIDEGKFALKYNGHLRYNNLLHMIPIPFLFLKAAKLHLPSFLISIL